MRAFLILAFILASTAARAATFGFGFISLTGSTGIGGTVTTSVQIPGTFGGAVPVDPAAGRYLKNAMIWCDSPTAGDEITTLDIEDTDGVVPVPARGAFPNYPVIFNLLDSATGGTSGIFIPSGGITMDAFDQSGQPSMKLIPSQLYLKLTYQAGGLSLGKTYRAVIRWGIWQ